MEVQTCYARPQICEDGSKWLGMFTSDGTFGLRLRCFPPPAKPLFLRVAF